MKKQIFLIAMLFALGSIFNQIRITNEDWPIGVLFNATIFFIGLEKIVNRKKIEDLKIIVALTGFAFLIETIGIVTGFPYGKFEYGNMLGPKIFELVPIFMPLSYIPLVIGATELSRKINAEKYQIIIATLILIVFDIVIDPGATKLGFWVWENTQGYYGVPYTNFFGWALSAIVATWIASKIKDTQGAEIGGILQIAFWSAFSIFNEIHLSGLIGIGIVALYIKSKLETT